MPAVAPPLNHDEIARRIPHASAMCLLTRATHWDEHSIRCETESHRAPENPLRSDGNLPVTAGVEYAAQAAALHATLTSAAQAPPRRGFIAVLNDIRWSVQRLDDTASPLSIEVRRLSAMSDGAQYEFIVAAPGGEALVQGQFIVAFEP